MTRALNLALIALALSSAPSAGQGASPQSAAQPLTLRTDDGVAIAADLTVPAVLPAPAVILVHMFSRTRGDWEPARARLAEAGFVVMAIDLRGHGASGTAAGAAAGPEDMNPSVLDVKAARVYLTGRPDLSTGAVGIAGAQVGANLAIVEAAADPLVRSIALLSPGIDYRRVRPEPALAKYGKRPALIVASSEDAYASRSARALAIQGGGVRDLRIVSGAGHGTVMLARQPDLIGVLVDWFRRTLL